MFWLSVEEHHVARYLLAHEPCSVKLDEDSKSLPRLVLCVNQMATSMLEISGFYPLSEIFFP
jgi:hypothetical protein